VRGLYAIIDTGTLAARQLDPVAFGEAVLVARPAALQLRAKDLPPRETLALLRALAPLCHRNGVLLVANDRPDLAVMAGCDSVHIGQTDMPIERVRRIAPGIGVGVSTHTMEQLDAALAARPEYVAFGPVFATATKDNPDPVVGVAGLRAASARASAAGVPLVAIGGITCARTGELVDMVAAVAIVADLVPPVSSTDVWRDVTARARAIQALFAPPPIVAGAVR
jgi:thiamine-phosphate pyrophosphorylase